MSLIFENITLIIKYFYSAACSTEDPCLNGGKCNKGICSCTSEFNGHRCQNGKFIDIYIDHYCINIISSVVYC